MEKPTLYCDCDGVILNTIEVAFNLMQEMGCDMSDGNQIDRYFREEINWIDIFDRATIINDSIGKIQLLRKSGIFDDVIILTKLSGGPHEERLKREIFGDYLPNTKVITLPFVVKKSSVISDPENHVLVDDEMRNCNDWQSKEGTAILFSKDIRDLNNNVVNDLIDIPNTNGVKKLLKTRYF